MIKKVESLTGSLSMPRGGSGGGGSGTSGKSPYIGENGNWFEYNDVLQAWTDTGVRAEGKDGLNGADGKDGTNGIDGNNGTSITSALVNNDGDLIVTLDTGVSLNTGHVKGADGTSINIKGDLLSPDDLPSSDQELGDCYIILGHLWVYVDSTDIGAVNGFKDVGNIQGVDGKSAYEVAISNGFVGTEPEWLLSLKGDKGDKGEQGADGINGLNGADGKDGIDGLDGKSAYEIAVENGFVGTEAEWLASLKGADGDKGDKGDKGEDGYTPVKGVDYFTADDIASLGINPTITTDLSSTTQTVTLTDNTEYRYGTLTSLAITWTTSDTRCSVAFTGGVGVTFSITAGTKIVGTDVASGIFKPVKGKRYNLGFEFDGINRTMYVSGVE